MTIRLRAHHLLCMLTYVGKGYSPAFTANYDVIAGRLSAGEDILLVAGPDDICAPLLGDEDCHCHRPSVIERDVEATKALSSLLARTFGTGSRIVLDEKMLATMRSAFATGKTRQACRECEWSELCRQVADGGFAGAKIAIR
ncbi:DUF1284 domain-containing protein [Phyllobacterium salinisoli]|uniref:DUF1284 domain-containing protein n=1 Tax=Phyllobacterium salinisoli TaxID=1899321 RepID=A0A368K5N9_9HYPH|nr:DUF1284 domain-containing protein [Phyllobacterium salinisoli]RCS23692.1 DUF1284 domain-containing protein [Phyllobacterium salinisoli]